MDDPTDEPRLFALPDMDLTPDDSPRPTETMADMTEVELSNVRLELERLRAVKRTIAVRIATLVTEEETLNQAVGLYRRRAQAVRREATPPSEEDPDA